MKSSKLYRYQMVTRPDLTVWYEPLTRRQQAHRRSETAKFGTPFILLSCTLHDRLVMLEDSVRGRVSMRDDEHWDEVLDVLGRTARFEAGAATLGWRLRADEEFDDFVARVEKDLDGE